MELQNLYVLKYNNYYNRIVKKFDTLNEYLVAPFYSGQNQINISFNPNDSVGTTQVVNFNPDGDYVIVGNQNSTINSRWFIVEQKRTKAGQYIITLKRDVLADNYDKMISSPMFIEKSHLMADNPLIFNNEGMTFNQIKKSELFLKDKSKCEWLVGYVKKNAIIPNEGNTITIPSVLNETIKINAGNLESWEFYPYITSEMIGFPSQRRIHVRAKFEGGGGSGDVFPFSMYFDQNDGTLSKWYASNKGADSNLKHSEHNAPIPQQIYDSVENYTGEINGAIQAMTEHSTREKESLLKSFKDKKIEFNNGRVYLVSLIEKTRTDKGYDITNTSPIYPYLDNQISPLFNVTHANNSAFDLFIDYIGYTIRVHEVVGNESTIDITNRNTISNGLYDCFCLPLGSFSYKYNNIVYSTNADMSERIAIAIMKASGNDMLDLQRLPYCPCQELLESAIYGNEILDLSAIGSNKYYAVANGPSGPIGLVLFPIQSTISFNLNYSLEIERPIANVGANMSSTTIQRYEFGTVVASLTRQNITSNFIPNQMEYPNALGYTINSISLLGSTNCTVHSSTLNANKTITANITPTRIGIVGLEYELNVTTEWITPPTFLNPIEIDTKVSNECDIYRLTSPNYAGMFEFSVAKNGGVDYFVADITLKPFVPYLHIYPLFKGLYGDSFGDSRGLICGGDFTYGLISDAFTDYENANKNYSNIFDREIKNMDFNNKMQWIESSFGMAGGVVSGAASGAVTGAMVGGPVGAGIGAAVGGVASLAGGITDLALLGQKQGEAKSYKTDMYNYALGNIKAMPNSLTKVTSYSANYKGYPFIEHFSCTDIEKDAFISKLTYDGMTNMTIGKIEDYIYSNRTYIKGYLIRIEDLGVNSEMANEIYNALNKGIYIGGND